LYQFAINTNNGTPDWYIDLRSSLTHNFNAPQPEAVLSGTQVTGLDGAYWVNVDGANFAMVSKTGGFTLYFSVGAVEPDCGTGTGNTNPVADISATPISGEAPLLVTFDASASTDVDGDALSYSWDFGDGSIVNGVTVENTFTSIGTYPVTLIVEDGNGGIDQAVITITVSDGDIIIDPPTGNAYIDRFVEMRNKFYDPANGYL